MCEAGLESVMIVGLVALVGWVAYSIGYGRGWRDRHENGVPSQHSE